MKTQECTICHSVKPMADFYKNIRSKNGYQRHCRACHREMTKKWENENRDEKRRINREAMRVYRKKHPGRVKRLAKKYRLLRGKEYQRRNKERSRKERIDIINRYGGKCECCGIDDYRFLCLDHKNNDGYKHRKKIRSGSTNIHVWIKKNNYPDSIRVLCFNCNFARAFYGGKDKICPHKL